MNNVNDYLRKLNIIYSIINNNNNNVNTNINNLIQDIKYKYRYSKNYLNELYDIVVKFNDKNMAKELFEFIITLIFKDFKINLNLIDMYIDLSTGPIQNYFKYLKSIGANKCTLDDGYMSLNKILMTNFNLQPKNINFNFKPTLSTPIMVLTFDQMLNAIDQNIDRFLATINRNFKIYDADSKFGSEEIFISYVFPKIKMNPYYKGICDNLLSVDIDTLLYVDDMALSGTNIIGAFDEYFYHNKDTLLLKNVYIVLGSATEDSIYGINDLFESYGVDVSITYTYLISPFPESDNQIMSVYKPLHDMSMLHMTYEEEVAFINDIRNTYEVYYNVVTNYKLPTQHVIPIDYFNLITTVKPDSDYKNRYYQALSQTGCNPFNSPNFKTDI